MEKVELAWPEEWEGPELRSLNTDDTLVCVIPGLGFKAADRDSAIKLAEAHNALLKQHRRVLRVLAEYERAKSFLSLASSADEQERYRNAKAEYDRLIEQAAAIVPEEAE